VEFPTIGVRFNCVITKPDNKSVRHLASQQLSGAVEKNINDFDFIRAMKNRSEIIGYQDRNVCVATQA